MDKKKFVWNRDRFFSVGMAVVSIAVIYLATQIKPTFAVGSGSDPGSKVFPIGVAILLLVSSIGKFITCNKPDETGWVEGKKGWLKILAVLGLLFIYLQALPLLGYILCTFVATLLLLLIMKGDRRIRPWTYFVYPAILTAVLYIMFKYILLVTLPMGTLWQGIL